MINCCLENWWNKQPRHNKQFGVCRETVVSVWRMHSDCYNLQQAYSKSREFDSPQTDCARAYEARLTVHKQQSWQLLCCPVIFAKWCLPKSYSSVVDTKQALLALWFASEEQVVGIFCHSSTGRVGLKVKGKWGHSKSDCCNIHLIPCAEFHHPTLGIF